MSRENFHDALRAYGIVPHQHKLKWVLEGLSTMKSITKQPTQEKRSTSYLETIDLCNRRIKWRLKEKRGHQLRIDAGQDTESMDEKRREAIRLLDIKIKEQERLRSRAELGL